MRAIPVHTGRPLYSRVKRGYKGDLAALQKLRFAVLGDTRISTQSYKRVADALAVVDRVLRKYAAPKPVKARKRK